MEGFEEKLGQLLGDPGAMQQILSLAQSLGGSGPPPPQGEKAPPPPPPPGPPPGPPQGPPGMEGEALLRMLAELSRNTRDDPKQLALFQALKPFLRPERAAKLDRAVQAARLSRMASVALERFAPNFFPGR